MNSGQNQSNGPLIVELPNEEKILTPAKRLFHSLEHWYANNYLLSENVWIQLNPSAYNRVALKLIASINPGCGSPALDYLCSLADSAECEIILVIHPQRIKDTRRLTKAQLKRWYKSRCFIQSAEYTGDVYIRLPQKRC
ncbi:hypothetical protein [Hymenobacter armeniacus]|uniref:Uncharacterized protein n=1 Tax=Hymenobacter armeniacus TaxID=2771358 RepID=A0ABR8JLE2_9BACT|nr:hypothetical protein [Hymenobacter armeniacus]MBD2720817.1 hypothetical protein [Hymenobacter armeniacus]